MTRLLSPVLSLALALPAVPAFAADPPPTPKASPTDEDTARAKELFENGRQLYLDGSYDAAIAAFRESYALSGDPILLYNIFQCYDRLEDYDAAIEYVEHYRAFAPASERDALTEQVESLRRRKLKKQAEAEEEAGAKKEEPRPEERTVAPVEVTPVDQPKQKVYTPLAITFTVITAVAIGIGIGLGVASANRKRDAEDQCAGDPLICPAGAESDVSTSRSLGLGANVTFAIAGAAGIALITVLAVNGTQRRRQKNANARVRVVPSRGGVAVEF